MLTSEVHTHDFPHAFTDLTYSYLNRYPSDLSPHIISSDFLSASLDAQGCLCTTKIVRKRGKLPRWAPRGIISKAETFVLEESRVDPLEGSLSSQTRNLDHRTVLDINEKYTLRAQGPQRTVNMIQGIIQSSVGSDSMFTDLLRGRIESFGLASFNRNILRSRTSLLHVHSLLHTGKATDPPPPPVALQRFPRLADWYVRAKSRVLGLWYGR